MNKIAGQLNAIDSFMGTVMKDLNKLRASKPMGYETSLDINGYEFDCIVDFEITPACEGGRGDFGMKTEPDEPASIYLGDVYIFDRRWQLIDIPKKAMTEILEEILCHELER